MTPESLDLDSIARATLAHCDQQVDDFWEGTRDHDVVEIKQMADQRETSDHDLVQNLRTPPCHGRCSSVKQIP